ncbi:hypothetical protein PF023_10065 [Enterococcus thailandicus]|uniref:hypothetical protein n=1 Tax=Enterococcus thailandicus TaxID=417368 RepID=UPI0022EBE343|nr:hypothetical protein [Enterococcus thailandicus]MDA3974393.1 hypothetical protein [Enterococcus thailandicus]MDA3976880.1 hypothetical protein [Enterococcus thailandicus]MDA3981846.1 hypothetical protein [Enterococcus thailandicus]
MKKKYLGLKVWVSVVAVTFVLSVVATSGSMIVSANELFPDETQNSESYFNDEDLAIYYSKEEKNSERALEKIKKKYGDVQPKFNEDGEILLTPEDEMRLDTATTEYLKAVGYSSYLRRFGRNWWNSRSFIGGVIDDAFIALGFGAGARSANQIIQIIRVNRRNITRSIERQLRTKVGITLGNWLSAGLDAAGALSGISLGYAVAWGIDYVDGKRLDGYILA